MNRERGGGRHSQHLSSRCFLFSPYSLLRLVHFALAVHFFPKPSLGPTSSTSQGETQLPSVLAVLMLQV